MSPTVQQRSGFVAYGIYSLPKQIILSKIPSKDVMPKTIISDELSKKSNKSREKNSIRKEKKLNVIPSQSVAVENSSEKTNDADLPYTSKILTITRQITLQDPESRSDSDDEDFYNSKDSFDTNLVL